MRPGTDFRVHEPCPRVAEAVGPRWFCSTCERVVHDLTALSEPEAREVVRARECVRYVVGRDGALLRRPSRRTLLRAALAALAAWVPGAAHAARTLSGVVVDRAGRPVPDAVVSVAGQRALTELVTDEAGRFAIETLRDGDGGDVPLVRGIYLVRVEKPGFQPTESVIHYRRGAALLEPIELLPGGPPPERTDSRYRAPSGFEGGEPLPYEPRAVSGPRGR